MIRRQRNQLVRELWRLRQRISILAESPPGPGGCDDRGHPGPPTVSLIPSIELGLKSALNSILKRLDVDDLELLLVAIRRRASPPDQCIILPQQKPSQSNGPRFSSSSGDGLEPPPTDSYSAHWLVCRMFRWSDLSVSEQLRRIPACRHEDCVNPAHWYRVIDTGTVALLLDLHTVRTGRLAVLQQVFGELWAQLGNRSLILTKRPRSASLSMNSNIKPIFLA